MKYVHVYLLWLWGSFLVSHYCDSQNNREQKIITNIRSYVQPQLSEKLFSDFYGLANATQPTVDEPITYTAPKEVPLFDAFPALREHIPYLALGTLPTPITRCNNAQETFGIKNLYIKRDDRTGTLYGGNKVRKLEFLFGDALEYFKNVSPDGRMVITLGAAGSNHALATARYAELNRFRCALMLTDEPNSKSVRNNLLADYLTGAQLLFSPTRNIRAIRMLNEILYNKQQFGSLPYIIPVGGSNPVGALGFVNAAFELKKQIDDGRMPEPDRIYLAIGSGGTHAGLLLGIKALGLKSKVVAVLIEPADIQKIKASQMSLLEKTNELLSSADPMFPHVSISQDDLIIVDGHTGDNYGLFTQEGIDAAHRLYQTEGIELDGTYTAKAFAGLLENVVATRSKSDVILFWDTFSSASLVGGVAGVDYHQLPRPLHKFFEEPVQSIEP